MTSWCSCAKTINDAPNAPPPAMKGRRSSGAPLKRLTGRHFPSSILPQPGAKKARPTRACHVCNVAVGKRKEPGTSRQRKETRFECKICGKALCIVPCFERYHTVRYYLPKDLNASTYSQSDMEDSDKESAEESESE
jgi:hypothetical protein